MELLQKALEQSQRFAQIGDVQLGRQRQGIDELRTRALGQFGRQQDRVSEIYGNLGRFQEETGLQDALKRQLGLVDEERGFSPQGRAAMNLELTRNIPHQYNQAAEAMRVELRRRGALGGETPGSRGDIMRGMAPLQAAREQARSTARSQMIMADEAQRLQSLLANRGLAGQALQTGVSQMGVGTQLLGTTAQAMSPQSLTQLLSTVSGAENPQGWANLALQARGLGQQAFGMGTESERVSQGALDAWGKERGVDYIAGLLSALPGLGAKAMDKAIPDAKWTDFIPDVDINIGGGGLGLG
jgi:hypothetical protein